jgi:hypothetical protein
MAQRIKRPKGSRSNRRRRSGRVETHAEILADIDRLTEALKAFNAPAHKLELVKPPTASDQRVVLRIAGLSEAVKAFKLLN